jgi:hypothetical protein
MRWTCVATVLELITSLAAIWAAVSPSASNRSTSLSRGVSSSSCVPALIEGGSACVVSFGDQTFSPGLGDEAGEKTAVNANLSGGLRQPNFTASFMIGTTQAAQQCSTCATPLSLSVSPDRGDGARMSYLRFEDHPDGVHVYFIDVKDPGPVGHVADFRESDIATLDRAHSHVVTFEIKFKDGAHNDEVHIYIDGQKKKDGTTWEDYYRYDPEQAGSGNQVPTVDKLLFREGGTMNPTDAGGGFLIDRVLLTSSGPTR